MARLSGTVLLLIPRVLLGASALEVVPVDEGEARAWLRHVVPMPQRVRIKGQVTVPVGSVDVPAVPHMDPLTDQATADMRACVGPRGAGAPAFTVEMRLGSGTDTAPLRALPNAEQAYRIALLPGAARIRLSATTASGLRYAVKTLCQLVRARRSAGWLTFPVGTITDWPDLESRGLWGGDTHLCLDRLSELNLNAVSHISFLEVDGEGRGHARMKADREALLTGLQRHGIRNVPVVLHLEQLSSKGLFEAYPGLAARGGQKGAVCYSQPQFVDVLADWIADLGALPHVTTVDVWMTENLHGKGGCRCRACSLTDRSVLEIRTILTAWRRAAERVPGVGLRVLTSEETARGGGNRLIFRELPSGVEVVYYHSLLTYTTGDTEVVHPDVVAFVQSGGRAAVCMNLCAWVGQVLPFSGASFVRSRMSEVARKGLFGFQGYAVPTVACNRLNVEAAAEWSWNLDGRSTREFALSYAVRHGIEPPESFARWAETIGPVAWDVYGSDWPVAEKRRHPDPVADGLRSGTLPPLGTVKWDAFRGPWGDVHSEEELRRDVTAADEALALAREIGRSDLIGESLAVQGLVRSLAALYALQRLVTNGRVQAGRRDAARDAFTAYVDALGQTADAIQAWAPLVEPAHDLSNHVAKTVGLIGKAADEMAGLSVELGCPVR